MDLLSKELLRQLGSGESIDAVRDRTGMTRGQFDARWKRTAESRVPPTSGRRRAAVDAAVRIERDRWGIPHVFAESDRDLFFGFGYAMAQDRLFQLDYLRRKGLGHLSEILGADGLERDSIARTVGLNRIAAAELNRLSAEVRQVLDAFSAGVNALIEDSGDNLPVEFDLLAYQPEPWSPLDCLAIENEFRWYLTGRLPVIVLPEMARRALGQGKLYEEYLLGEADDESILEPGEYPPRSGDVPSEAEPIGQAVNDPEAAVGSNNWVLAGSRTTTGMPLLGSDPHIAFEAVSCWYEAHLCGGSFNVAGMAYVGMPAILFGRNERVAWGITNNICSQRDLYQEKTDPQHPGCFLFDGDYEPASELTEVISVRDSELVTKQIRFSRNGPVVDELLPGPARHTGPVTLKWLGAHEGGWLTSLLAMDRADSVEAFRRALRPWHVPTFSLVIADVDGNIGYQSAGRVPLRSVAERGYRPGWDPRHQWQGVIPLDAMPCSVNPPRGWLASANNRPAPDDFPYPLFGCWSSGWRARRIRQMIESTPKLGMDELRQMHLDATNLRAADFVPALVSVLETASNSDGRIDQAVHLLTVWDYRCEPDSVAATIFNVFFTHWCRTVATEHFEADAIDLMHKGVEGCAARLMRADPAGWFAGHDRETKIVQSFRAALDTLSDRLGGEVSTWTWERLHRMPLKHVLSGRGDLGQLLDHGGAGVRGDMGTVCNTGCAPNWEAATGAGYRLMADLGASPPRLMAIDVQSQSGHPGSRHYRDQYDPWLAGKYHEIPLDRAEASRAAVKRLVLEPR